MLFRPKAFYPPRFSGLVLWLFHRLLPVMLRYGFGQLKPRFAKADLQRVKALKGQRVLLLPNHPTIDDPAVMFAFSKACGIPFRYVCAREVFEFNGGLRGWLFQRLGVYSVIRGATDRQSFKTSRRILVEGEAPLVIFVEGEVSYRTDTLLPLEPGVFQLAFMAQEELARQHKEPSTCPGITVLPVSIRYSVDGRFAESMEASLEKLEAQARIHPEETGPNSFIPRLRNLGLHVLEVQEQRFQFQVPETISLQDRLVRLQGKLLNEMEEALDLAPGADISALERVRQIRNAVDKTIYAYETPEHLSPYAERVHLEEQGRRYRTFYHDLERVVALMTLHGEYLTESTTQERQLELLTRLEREILGKLEYKIPKNATLKLGEPFQLLDHLERYRDNKRTTLEELTEFTRQQVLAGLSR